MSETDVLNQEQDTTANDVYANDLAEEDEDLFADWAPEEDDKPTSTEEENQNVDDRDKDEESLNTNTDQQVASSQDQPSFMTIKYNKEPRNLTKEEAITLAQKGMNYDEIYSRYNTLKESEGMISELDRIAKANGLTSKELVNNLIKAQDEFELSKEVDALRQQYPNSDEEVLKELAKVHISTKVNLVSKKQEEEANARKQEISRQMDVFNQRYPNVDPSKLEQGVYSLMKSGYTLLEAYETINAEKRNAEEQKRESLEKIEKQNMENRRKSLGNLSNSGYSEDDEFIKELFSD